MDKKIDDKPTPAGQRDYVLSMMARLNTGIGITLHTHGLLVTGIVISQAKFFERVAEGLHEGSGDRPQRNMFDALADVAMEGAAKPLEESDLDSAEFLHLDNVQIMVPGQPGVPSNPTVWRVRLSEVSGFTVGRIGPG